MMSYDNYHNTTKVTTDPDPEYELVGDERNILLGAPNQSVKVAHLSLGRWHRPAKRFWWRVQSHELRDCAHAVVRAVDR